MAASLPTQTAWTRTLRLLVVLTIAYVTAAWLARSTFARPVSDANPDLTAFGFAACALPCWAGIEAGQTPFVRANELIAGTLEGISHQIMVSGSQITVIARREERRFIAQVHYNGGLAGALRLRVDLPLVDLIGDLGLPACARFNRTLALTWFFRRDDESIIITALADRVSLDGAMTEMWIAPAGATCAEIDSLPWRGFGPNWIYAAVG